MRAHDISHVRGLSLVEVLIVMVVIAILSLLAVPALTSMQSSYALDSTGQAIVAQLGVGRQSALALSRPVEVRFYQIADFNSSTKVYRAMQLFEVGATATTPLNKPYFFPAPVRVLQATSGTTNISSLLTTAYSGISVSTISDPNNPLPPPYGSSYTYEYFHFRANGMTDLSITTSITSLLTVGSENAQPKANNLPANYVTLSFNALSGSMETYRP